ncbi:Hint domain-containing protein [Roseibacterium sp. SDUM158017]|uniref:Hint domain-containing protein n=1 Tax=Roseicyclus salinarum TaxID=3036773 RepID=UPI002414FDA8|nr:Hint domain-containing protein [Roseibacterium sp. SDUM158017]MDG4648408.1 Hint domain-containing protein [Roseibacterium sp. SDUM158017]
MSDYDDPVNAAHLVGLWDFRDGAPAADGGLADGVEQDGTFFADATAAGGALLLDGKGDRFDVAGGGTAFDLRQGTIAVRFVQDEAAKGLNHTILNRGEFDDAASEGHFAIEVTREGAVVLRHAIQGGPQSILTSAPGLIASGDAVTVIYGWNEATGASLIVDNETTGATQTLETAVTGLTLAVGDGDAESFTFGAREQDDGQFSNHFDGSIDYVAIYDKDISNGDFVVEGTSGPDLIDTAYTGDPEGDLIDAGDNEAGTDADVVDARAGDDTIAAGEGDDTVYAGAGNDEVRGEAGDDVLYGDASLGTATLRESFEWDLAPDPDDGGAIDDGDAITGFTQNTGSVDVTFSVLTPNTAVLNEYQETEQLTDGINTGGETIDPDSSLSSDIRADGNGEAYQLAFSEAVRNVQFRINDIDLDSVVSIQAFDAQGQPIEVVLSPGANLEALDTDGVAGIDTVRSTGLPGADDDPANSVLVSVAGPVASIVITHSADAGGTGFTPSGVNVTDVYFDVVTEAPVPSPAGDDTLDGGSGDDLLLGEDGRDSLIGGEGDDTLDGGAGRDTLDGGIGNDLITDLEGDNVVNGGLEGLPDRGFPFIGNADPDPFDDRDTVTTGAGDDLISTGDDADVIVSGAGDDTIDGGFDDDVIDAGEGADQIVSGEGSDTVIAGDGDDTVYGGLGPGVGDLANLIDENVAPSRNDPIPDNGRDLIDAGAGNDLVFGQDDRDTILGGEGDDTLDGGIDDDLIEGGDGNDLLIGGQGADTLTGGFGNDTFEAGTFTDPIFGDEYVEGIGDSVTGGEDPDDGDIDVLDLSGSGPLKIIYDDAIDPGGETGESGKVIFYKDAAKTEAVGELVFKEIENVIPCFTPGALIATPNGKVPVETLREGDRILTRDNGFQEIRWVGSRTLSRQELQRAPNLKPVLIRAGSLGGGLPERDMLVSPQHRVLVFGGATQLYFAESEVLVAAKHLVGKPGVESADPSGATYVHFMFDRHEVVLSDGCWTESFQPGDMTLGAMGEAQRDEILSIFPELGTGAGQIGYGAARRALRSHEARLLQL